MKKYILLIGLMSILMQSCSVWVSPPYTEVSKISQVKKGDNVKTVNEKLGIEPYNIYFLTDSMFVFTYNYRHKYKKMNSSTINTKHNEESLTKGKPYYDKEGKLYIFYVDNKVNGMISDKGRDNGKYLLLHNNNIGIINKKGYYSIKKNYNQNIYFLDENNNLKMLDNFKTDTIKSVIIPIKNTKKKLLRKKKGVKHNRFHFVTSIFRDFYIATSIHGNHFYIATSIPFITSYAISYFGPESNGIDVSVGMDFNDSKYRIYGRIAETGETGAYSLIFEKPIFLSKSFAISPNGGFGYFFGAYSMYDIDSYSYYEEGGLGPSLGVNFEYAILNKLSLKFIVNYNIAIGAPYASHVEFGLKLGIKL